VGAAKHGKTLMVEFLLRRGAKVRLPDDPPWATPIAWATRRGHAHVVQLLTRFDEEGVLPPRPDQARYEALAHDLVDAWTSRHPEAVQRIVNHFQIWRLSNADQLRRQVARRLGLPECAGEQPEPLTLDQAHALVARMHGFESWQRLVSEGAG
jgi:hypothetical protein